MSFQPTNQNAPMLHGPTTRFVPHVAKSAYRAALLDELQRDSINGKGGQSDKTELHNRNKKAPPDFGSTAQ